MISFSRKTSLFLPQANPLYHKKPDIHLMGGSKGMVAANQPLVVPMLLRLSNFKLSSYVVLVVSKPKGITLVFKTDPLQNVDIHSTFDSITVIQKFIQKEIEGQLRQMFREDLPGIIHRLSQQWIKKSTTVEAPYLSNHPILKERSTLETMSNPDISRTRLPMLSPSLRPPSMRNLPLGSPIASTPRRQSFARSVSTRPSMNSLRTASDLPSYSVDDDEGDDSALRAFSHLGRIHRESRGLADLAEEQDDMEELDETGSFDVVDWDDTMTDVGGMRPPSETAYTEFETIPAVGGGVITRPRVYHASSLLRTNSGNFVQPPPSKTNTSRPAPHRLSQSFADVRDARPYASVPPSRHDSWDSVPPLGETSSLGEPLRSRPANDMEDDVEFPFPRENETGAQHLSRRDSDSLTDPSSSDAHQDSVSPSAYKRTSRRNSISSQVPSFVIHDDTDGEGDPKIIIRPNMNNAISQLSLLNRSNHTLSPYNRTSEHFMFRSIPPKTMLSPRSSASAERQPVKAKRKRVYRLGASTKPRVEDDTSTTGPDTAPRPPSPASPSSDFDESEIDRYFRSNEDFAPASDSRSFSPQYYQSQPPQPRRRQNIGRY